MTEVSLLCEDMLALEGQVSNSLAQVHEPNTPSRADCPLHAREVMHRLEAIHWQCRDELQMVGQAEHAGLGKKIAMHTAAMVRLKAQLETAGVSTGRVKQTTHAKGISQSDNNYVPNSSDGPRSSRAGCISHTTAMQGQDLQSGSEIGGGDAKVQQRRAVERPADAQ